MIATIDGKFLPTCRPGGDACVNQNLHDFQCYNGHHRQHGITFCMLQLPNGMAVPYGPWRGALHDRTMLGYSKVMSLYPFSIILVASSACMNMCRYVPLCLYLMSFIYRCWIILRNCITRLMSDTFCLEMQHMHCILMCRECSRTRVQAYDKKEGELHPKCLHAKSVKLAHLRSYKVCLRCIAI